MSHTKYYGLRRRKTFDEMLKEAMTHRLIITTIPEKRRVDLLMNEVDFDEFDLTNYGINKKYMSLNNNKYDTDMFPVMTLDKATQFPIREIKETQTDLPNDKETQTDDIDYTGLISDGFSKSFKSNLKNRAEAEVQASLFKPIQDGDDADEPDDDDDDDNGNKKKSLNLIRIIEFMLRSGFSVAEIIIHITYQTTLTTLQITELTAYIIGNSLITTFDITNGIMNWLSNNTNEEVELNTSPPVSVNSSPPITVNSSSTHTVNSTSQSSRASGEASSEENANYEIAPPTDIPVPTDAESDEENKDKDKNKEKQNLK